MRDAWSGEPSPTRHDGYGAYGRSVFTLAFPLPAWSCLNAAPRLQLPMCVAVASGVNPGTCRVKWRTKRVALTTLAARDALVECGVSDPARVVAYGASAGGLLVGTCVNGAPKAFCAAVLDVPFLDVLRTMQNPELPLTTAEYSVYRETPKHPKWPKPHSPHYSPMDNITAQTALWIEGSWFDTRVSYWSLPNITRSHSAAARQRPSLLLM